MLLEQIIPKLLEHCDPFQEEKGKILSQAVEEAEEAFTKDFTAEQKQAFRKYYEALNDYHCFETEYLEKICFSMGVNMMEEVKQATK